MVVKYHNLYFLLKILQIPTRMQCKIVTKNSIQKTIVLVQIPLTEIIEIRTGMKEIYLGNNLKKIKCVLLGWLSLWISGSQSPGALLRNQIRASALELSLQRREVWGLLYQTYLILHWVRVTLESVTTPQTHQPEQIPLFQGKT